MFNLGQIVYTQGIAAEIESGSITEHDIRRLLIKHQNGDWGNLCSEDKAANDYAAKHGQRILSSYIVAGIGKIWVITEWDRSVTTILFPSEY